MTVEEFTEIETLSGLLEVAVADGRAVLEDGRYRPDARIFHEPTEVPGECVVCAAGAVMAMSLGAPFGEKCELHQWGDGVSLRLMAIDRLRCSSIDGAFEALWDAGHSGPRGYRLHWVKALNEKTRGDTPPTLTAGGFRNRSDFRQFLASAEAVMLPWLKAHDL